MDYFLLQLSYSTTGWREIIEENAGFDKRLDKVRNLIAELGGSFANFHFHDRAPFKAADDSPVVRDKFSVFGAQDLIAILAMPDKRSAQTFSITLRAFPHIQDIRLTALMPFEETIDQSVKDANKIVRSKRFSGPGSSPAPKRP